MGKNRKFRGPLLESLEKRAMLSASVIYVDANISAHSNSAVHDGTTWAKAYGNLQDALTKAATTAGADQIWLAKGTYKPSQIYTPLNASSVPVVGGASGLNVSNLKTFNLPSNVSLFGGFEYGDKSLSKQDPDGNPTILSGDLLGNDNNASNPVLNQADKADNAWHIVTAGNDVTQQGVTATLDGLQFIGGYAAGPNVGGTLSPFIQGHSDGGGIYSAWGSNITINDDLFKYNFAASDGGGVFSDGSDLLATNSRFLNNSAITRAGGLEALNDFEIGSHTSTLINDYFQDNTCLVFGGAVVGEGAFQGANSKMTIKDSTFVHNQAPEGGAIVLDTLTVNIDSSTFINNVSTVNGGALSTTNVVGTIVGAPNNFVTTITNSSFINNSTKADKTIHDTFFPFPGINFALGGGALVAYMNGYLDLDHDVFIHNVTENSDGGAILNGKSSANIAANALFPGSAPVQASVVQTKVSNSIFTGNRALNGSGGAIASETDNVSPGVTANDSRLIVNNIAFAGNSSAVHGGGIYLGMSAATITGNIFLLDSAGGTGDEIYGEKSVINGFASSDPQAVISLKKTNFFLPADIVLS